MKLLIGAAVVALLAASPAFAQTAPAGAPNCSGFDAAPSNLPDGASASASRMSEGREQIVQWQTARDARLAQCLAEINAVRAALNAAETAYNQAVAEKNAVITAWAAETEEFNARGNSGSRRERGGTLTRPDN